MHQQPHQNQKELLERIGNAAEMTVAFVRFLRVHGRPDEADWYQKVAELLAIRDVESVIAVTATRPQPETEDTEPMLDGPTGSVLQCASAEDSYGQHCLWLRMTEATERALTNLRVFYQYEISHPLVDVASACELPRNALDKAAKFSALQRELEQERDHSAVVGAELEIAVQGAPVNGYDPFILEDPNATFAIRLCRHERVAYIWPIGGIWKVRPWMKESSHDPNRVTTASSLKQALDSL